MFFKRSFISAVCVIAAASAFSGCSSGSTPGSSLTGSASPTAEAEDPGSAADKYSVVCTIFPEYDWVKEIVGDHAESFDITYLLDKGTDLHNYQPTADDIMKISDCDMFVYVGGESDEWAEDAISEAVNKNIKVIDLMDIMGGAAKTEELKEGMDGHEEEHEEGEEEEYDEHIWLSLKNAKVLCAEIERSVEAVDPENAADYKKNYDTYIEKLNELDKDFEELVSGSSVNTLVFGDRFPFRYFVDDYGLDYYAAFVGCSAESEASFETIAFLADKVNELDCSTVFTLEKSDKKIAETVIKTSGKKAEIAELDSLQSVSADDIENGASYLSLMRKNYDVLKAVMG